jgi:hypothetical protein
MHADAATCHVGLEFIDADGVQTATFTIGSFQPGLRAMKNKTLITTALHVNVE